MTSLVLDSLEVRGFRPLVRLSIPRLGRVNLITGENNVGKSSLLEALQLYASAGDPSAVRAMLQVRDELRGGLRYQDDTPDWAIAAVSRLFSGQSSLPEPDAAIVIGPRERPGQTFSFALGLVERLDWPDGSVRFVRVPFDEPHLSEPAPLLAVFAQYGSGEPRSAQVESYLGRASRRWLPQVCPWQLVSANGLDSRMAAKLWDDIALTDREAEVLAALRIIAPEIEGVSLVGAGAERPDQPTLRAPIARARGMTQPVPLRSMGEGMNRLFGLALALVNAKDGLLLVDEVESGLHYSKHLDLWRLVFQVARRLDVQVFATTHSWDCITAFQHASEEDSASEGVLLRLEAKADGTEAVLFDERELAIATRHEIEVR